MNRRGFLAGLAGASVAKPKAEATVSAESILRIKDTASAAYPPTAVWQSAYAEYQIPRNIKIIVDGRQLARAVAASQDRLLRLAD